SRRERDRARDEAENAGAIEAFLSKDVLAKASASNQATATETPKADLKLREALDNAAGKIGNRFQGKPKIEGSIRQVIGETYLGLELYDKAIEHLMRAYALRQQSFGPDEPETLIAEAKLARALIGADRLKEAEDHLVHARSGLLQTRGAVSPEYLTALNNLGE